MPKPLIQKSKILNKKDAIVFLGLTRKEFENYSRKSNEIIGTKVHNRWYFDKSFLISYKKMMNERIVRLTTKEYAECFEFAIKMVYGGLSLNGIRGQRSEMQGADDVILGILGEHATRKFLKNKFKFIIQLDTNVHTSHITPQDIVQIKDGVTNTERGPKLGIGIKSSKMKSGFLVLTPNEIKLPERKSDVYIFTRVGLPSDHLFRILREHSFFAKVTEFLDSQTSFRKIEPLIDVPVWICGYIYAGELEEVNSIPGQDFDGYRYVKSVAKMHNTDTDWQSLIRSL